LGLSFGHFHAIDGKASGRGIAAVAASIASPDDGRKQGHPNDRCPDYLCPICMAASAVASALASTPPALPLEFDNVTIEHTIVLVFASSSRHRRRFNRAGRRFPEFAASTLL